MRRRMGVAGADLALGSLPLGVSGALVLSLLGEDLQMAWRLMERIGVQKAGRIMLRACRQVLGLHSNGNARGTCMVPMFSRNYRQASCYLIGRNTADSMTLEVMQNKIAAARAASMCCMLEEIAAMRRLL